MGRWVGGEVEKERFCALEEKELKQQRDVNVPDRKETLRGEADRDK